MSKTESKAISAKLNGQYAETFQHLLSELQKEIPTASPRQLIEKLLDEKVTFTVTQEAEVVAEELQSRNQYVFELQTEIESLKTEKQNLQAQLADAVDKNAKLVKLAEEATGFSFTPEEENKLVEIQEKLTAHYGEEVTVEDIVRVFVVGLMQNPKDKRLPASKDFLKIAREKLASIDLS